VVYDDGKYQVKIRSKRNEKAIPNSWDDIVASAERGWKRHRKTQYKVREIGE